jgi:hypothetical protein
VSSPCGPRLWQEGCPRRRGSGWQPIVLLPASRAGNAFTSCTRLVSTRVRARGIKNSRAKPSVGSFGHPCLPTTSRRRRRGPADSIRRRSSRTWNTSRTAGRRAATTSPSSTVRSSVAATPAACFPSRGPGRMAPAMPTRHAPSSARIPPPLQRPVALPATAGEARARGACGTRSSLQHRARDRERLRLGGSLPRGRRRRRCPGFRPMARRRPRASPFAAFAGQRDRAWQGRGRRSTHDSVVDRSRRRPHPPTQADQTPRVRPRQARSPALPRSRCRSAAGATRCSSPLPRTCGRTSFRARWPVLPCPGQSSLLVALKNCTGDSRGGARLRRSSGLALARPHTRHGWQPPSTNRWRTRCTVPSPQRTAAAVSWSSRFGWPPASCAPAPAAGPRTGPCAACPHIRPLLVVELDPYLFVRTAPSPSRARPSERLLLP